MTISHIDNTDDNDAKIKNENEIINNINDYFKHPIWYDSKKKLINPDIKQDLELIETIHDDNTPIYNQIFKPSNIFTTEIIKSSSDYYTTNTQFLKDTQYFLKKFKPITSSYDLNKIKDVILEIKTDNGFIEKYHYIDWEYWKFLNNSPAFLQLMSIYNLISPVISLLIPLFILIIPFFIIKIKGIPINVSEYVVVLRSVASNNAIGKLFTDFNSVDTSRKIYLIVSSAFYIFSIYQNILVCIRFHENMRKIHTYIETIVEYLDFSINQIENFLSHANQYKSYFEFNLIAQNKLQHLKNLKIQLQEITPYKLSFFKIKEMGTILKQFYDIYCDSDIHETLLYSFGFCGYIESMCELQSLSKRKKISFARINKKGKNKFKKVYYPPLMDGTPIKNDYDFKKNNIITGPNASGKTTILKTILINIILTQQFGCGFYSSANYTPYDYIHCYLNIPDTSGRDSLFQSETRKCNEIIKIINKNNKKNRHFCAFDELYSGTNPEEATKCGYAFLLYLSKIHNVHFSLTTHYLKICHKMDNIKNIDNYQMAVKINSDDDIEYTYTIEKGITNVNGGVEVLKQMNYPLEIMNTIKLADL